MGDVRISMTYRLLVGVGSKNSRRDFRLAYKMGVIHQKAGYQETVTILAAWEGGCNRKRLTPPTLYWVCINPPM